MSAELATRAVAVGMVGLFLLYRDRGTRTSPALWLAVVWLVLGASRTVTQWLGADLATASPDQYLEGSPLDRAVFSCLIVAGLLVLIARRQRTRDVLIRNAPLLLFLLYCAASVAWSDFPFVSLKRWVKLLGNFTMILIVLTEYDPAFAIKQFVARTAFILIPSSALVILYYPQIGE
jgi:exopolysaccharide production protein ExoQ